MTNEQKHAPAPALPHKLILPRTFWEDHAERCNDDHHPGQFATLRSNARTALVAMDDERLADLESDAAYYADRAGGPDDDYAVRVLRPSARATLRRLADYRRAAIAAAERSS